MSKHLDVTDVVIGRAGYWIPGLSAAAFAATVKQQAQLVSATDLLVAGPARWWLRPAAGAPPDGQAWQIYEVCVTMSDRRSGMRCRWSGPVQLRLRADGAFLVSEVNEAEAIVVTATGDALRYHGPVVNALLCYLIRVCPLAARGAAALDQHGGQGAPLLSADAWLATTPHHAGQAGINHVVVGRGSQFDPGALRYADELDAWLAGSGRGPVEPLGHATLGPRRSPVTWHLKQTTAARRPDGARGYRVHATGRDETYSVHYRWAGTVAIHSHAEDTVRVYRPTAAEAVVVAPSGTATRYTGTTVGLLLVDLVRSSALPHLGAAALHAQPPSSQPGCPDAAQWLADARADGASR